MTAGGSSYSLLSFTPKALAAVALMVGLAGCGGGSGDPVALPARLQSLDVVTHGSVVTLNSYVLKITSSELKFVETRAGKVTTDFSGQISAEDFQRVAALVDSANLTQTLGQRTGVSAPCRSADVDISITTDRAKHDFVIPGAETCGGAASPAYLQLSTLYSELIVKYVAPPAQNELP